MIFHSNLLFQEFVIGVNELHSFGCDAIDLSDAPSMFFLRALNIAAPFERFQEWIHYAVAEFYLVRDLHGFDYFIAPCWLGANQSEYHYVGQVSAYALYNLFFESFGHCFALSRMGLYVGAYLFWYV